MKVYIKNIPPSGLDLSETLESAALDFNDADVRCLTPLVVNAKVQRAGDEVLVKVTVQARYAFSCGRCLEPFEQERTDQFDLVFDIDPTTEFIDFNEDIREEIIIVLANVIDCREECKGLCSNCGVNLNKETCKCEK